MRFVLCFVAGIAVTAGCQGLPTPRPLSFKPRLADREAVAKALPQGHTLNQVIGADSKIVDDDGKCRYSNPVTLEEKLAEVGARVALDGKLCDAAGKEIFFDSCKGSGVWKSTETEQEERRVRQQREKNGRVIYIDYDPCGPNPC